MRYSLEPRYIARAPSGLPGPPAIKRGRYGWRDVIFRRRISFRLAGNGLRAGPGEALAADADAVANGAVLAEHVIERGVAGIDDHGAGRFAGIQGNDGPPQPLRQRAGASITSIGQRGFGR